jgi:hypothetical protein
MMGSENAEKILSPTRKCNGKQPLIKTSTTVSTLWKKGHMPSKKRWREQDYLKANKLNRTGLTALTYNVRDNDKNKLFFFSIWRDKCEILAREKLESFYLKKLRRVCI